MADVIGVLDSGVGGLSVLREIHRLLPNTPTLYFADQGHLPYGERSDAEILTFVDSITQFMLERGARLIVIACNAASAASLYAIRERYPALPFVGMEPAVKPAAEATRTGVIGVLTTRATANGQLYKAVVERYAKDTRVITQIAPELVYIAEQGSQHTPEGRAAITRAVAPIMDAGADQIALACTHFPFLSEAIQQIVGQGVSLIDPGPAVARQTARLIPTDFVPSAQPHQYFTSGDPSRFQMMLKSLISVDAPVMGVRVPIR